MAKSRAAWSGGCSRGGASSAMSNRFGCVNFDTVVLLPADTCHATRHTETHARRPRRELAGFNPVDHRGKFTGSGRHGRFDLSFGALDSSGELPALAEREVQRRG